MKPGREEGKEREKKPGIYRIQNTHTWYDRDYELLPWWLAAVPRYYSAVTENGPEPIPKVERKG